MKAPLCGVSGGVRGGGRGGARSSRGRRRRSTRGRRRRSTRGRLGSVTVPTRVHRQNKCVRVWRAATAGDFPSFRYYSSSASDRWSKSEGVVLWSIRGGVRGGGWGRARSSRGRRRRSTRGRLGSVTVPTRVHRQNKCVRVWRAVTPGISLHLGIIQAQLLIDGRKVKASSCGV